MQRCCYEAADAKRFRKATIRERPRAQSLLFLNALGFAHLDASSLRVACATADGRYARLRY
jgi:hypothetical protein